MNNWQSSYPVCGKEASSVSVDHLGCRVDKTLQQQLDIIRWNCWTVCSPADVSRSSGINASRSLPRLANWWGVMISCRKASHHPDLLLFWSLSVFKPHSGNRSHAWILCSHNNLHGQFGSEMHINMTPVTPVTPVRRQRSRECQNWSAEKPGRNADTQEERQAAHSRRKKPLMPRLGAVSVRSTVQDDLHHPCTKVPQRPSYTQ